MRILIVEDEYISRVLLSEILSVYGTCHTAINGEEAVEMMENSFKTDERFDLVCLDIMMPEMDGQEVLCRIRELEGERNIHGMDATKIIMTTALSDSGNIMQAFANGRCEAYLTKPLNKEKLIQHLREMCLVN